MLANSTKLTIFTLASGRSGTSYLADFFVKNVQQCYSTHEPYFVPGNPVLFGKPIDWNTRQNDKALLPVLERKCRFIANCKAPVYFESNHAFLKSFNRHAGVLLNNAGFIHLVRHPAKVAKSELLRERLIRKIHLPFANYTGDTGERYFRWALTGNEEIFRYYAGHTLSRFQFYLLQWIEIEYRAMRLIQQNRWQDRVFFIDVDTQLKEEAVLRQLLDFFNLRHKPRFSMDLHRNTTPFMGPTVITPQDELEVRWIFQNLPVAYKVMLKGEPYSTCLGWEGYRQAM
ncbi:hypothetical protein [Nitrosovibrio tenuis]|uniref:Sulfotransferase family protein n=1 Tax=Nitrosovibrio tenuis TaxID=1233 RepID=A0A1H7NTC5_9PROT|nr:hypothetical protein [Nitrosovibrio tenuis]SEL26187.1 hypothetical protein SAMN05216387_107115 [Nitrosovibrio tenuis]